MNNKIGLVLEGGGMRGIFSAGILDAFLKNKVEFPYVVGISAGAGLAVSYLSQQYQRNKQVNVDYYSKNKVAGLKTLVKTGDLFDFEMIYDKIPNEIIPVDYQKFFDSQVVFDTGLTSLQTGKIKYIEKNECAPDHKLMMKILKASGSIPIAAKPVKLQNEEFYDGGVAEAIPYQRPFSLGYEKAVLVLTRESGYQKKLSPSDKMIARHFHSHPEFQQTLLSRPKRYNQTLKEIEKLEKEGKVFVFRPKAENNISRTSQSYDELNGLYQHGFEQAEKRFSELKEWLK